MLLAPQLHGVPRDGLCFPGVIGDITNLGVGVDISSGSYAGNVAANAFANDGTATTWNGPNPSGLSDYIGWDWGVGCRPTIRRVMVQQGYNASNGTIRWITAYLQVSDDLVGWVTVQTISLNHTFPQEQSPIEYFDVTSPQPGRGFRIIGASVTSGGPIPVLAVRELEFIETVS